MILTFDHLNFKRNVISEVTFTNARLPIAALENGPLVYRIAIFCGGGDSCCGFLGYDIVPYVRT